MQSRKYYEAYRSPYDDVVTLNEFRKIPARFEMSTHKWKMVCGHSFQNEIIPRTSSVKKMKSWGFSN